jgi:hypothetical protein
MWGCCEGKVDATAADIPNGWAELHQLQRHPVTHSIKHSIASGEGYAQNSASLP